MRVYFKSAAILSKKQRKQGFPARSPSTPATHASMWATKKLEGLCLFIGRWRFTFARGLFSIDAKTESNNWLFIIQPYKGVVDIQLKKNLFPEPESSNRGRHALSSPLFNTPTPIPSSNKHGAHKGSVFCELIPSSHQINLFHWVENRPH